MIKTASATCKTSGVFGRTWDLCLRAAGSKLRRPLVKRGAQVSAASRSEEKLAALQSAGTVGTLRVDATVPEQVDRFAEEAVRRRG